MVFDGIRVAEGRVDRGKLGNCSTVLVESIDPKLQFHLKLYYSAFSNLVLKLPSIGSFVFMPRARAC